MSGTALLESQVRHRTVTAAHGRIAAVCLTVAAATTATWVIGRSAIFAGVVLVVALSALVLAERIGFRTSAFAVALVLTPPGLAGENNAVLAMSALGALFLVLQTASRQPPTSARERVVMLASALLAVEGVAFCASALVTGDERTQRVYVIVAALHLAAALVTTQLGASPDIVRSAMRLFAHLVAAASASYIFAWLLGFTPMFPVDLPYRSIHYVPPGTLVTAHRTEYLGTPRFTVFSGEPGLGGVFLIIAVALVIALERGWRRRVLLALLAIGVAAAQSAGLLLAFLAMGGAAAAIVAARKLTFLAGTALTVGLVPVGVAVADWLVASKARTNPLSLTDRGFTDGTPDPGISLSALWSHSPELALPLVILIFILGVHTVRSPIAFGAVAAIAVMSWYVQPVQFHPGIWLMLLATVLVTTVQSVQSHQSRAGGSL